MTIFDLLFIVLFLASVVTLIVAAVSAIRGRGAKAISILQRYAICFLMYMAVVLGVALATPRRVIDPGANQCFDDWCIAIEKLSRIPMADGVVYAVTLRLSSQARRVTQREKGIQVHLTDDRGRRFDPAAAPDAIPFDVLLQPGEAVETTRSFTVPNDARDIGLVVAHEGSYCFPGCFIIGDGSILGKHAVSRLP